MANGNPSNIIIKDEVTDWYYDLAMYDDQKGRLAIALWDRWKLDGGGSR